MSCYYYHLDHLGTPQVLSNASGQLVWQAVYEPFGKMTAVASGIPVAERVRFPGQYYDSESGLHQNWWRDYSPRVGRYLEADKIGIQGGANHLYGYANGNPVRYSDRLGNFVEVGTRYFYPIPVFVGEDLEPLYHCFVRFNGDSRDTLSFDNGGVHADPAASKQSRIINSLYKVEYSEVVPKCDEKDSCVRGEMGKCKNFNIVDRNCCDCVRRALAGCGLEKKGPWPNFGQ